MAIIDDGYLLGPTKALVAVLTEYKKNLKAIGGSLNEDKSAALLGARCELPEDFPVPTRRGVHRGTIYDSGPTVTAPVEKQATLSDTESSA